MKKIGSNHNIDTRTGGWKTHGPHGWKENCPSIAHAQDVWVKTGPGLIGCVFVELDMLLWLVLCRDGFLLPGVLSYCFGVSLSKLGL